jgi:hypothetical protein
MIVTDRYYRVVAKCGHVGRGMYYEGSFYVCSASGRDAARLVRNMPRVKHNHKDAILYVECIDRDVYQQGLLDQQSNPYWNCTSPQDQELCWDYIKPYLRVETEEQLEFREYRYAKHLRYLKTEEPKPNRKKVYNRNRMSREDLMLSITCQ